MNLTQDRIPGGYKEDRVSFKNQIQYKVSIIHGSNPTLEKRGRKNRKGEKERRLGGEGAAPRLGEEGGGESG